ncbi:unnamed protein product [Darwinula stevensoni]|uniref:TEP1-F n=1 Tax=Darwinula stevensoni TaxID=69355 RepID=A0A7R8XD64_9CRUS|nr:unnamed protein product [Darwinula stevensoni]CAG0894419.1 unnamed protein product [Darwinula stevensoni]
MKRYLLTVPKILQSNSTESACLSFLNVNSSGSAVLTITKQGSDDILAGLRHRFKNGASECLELFIPPVSKSTALFSLKLEFDDLPDYKVNNSNQVEIGSSPAITFIQTDKPLYQPGQKVQFRILTVDSSLHALDDQVREVWVEDPSGIRVAQWNQLETKSGFVQLEFQLSAEPPLGAWKIKAEMKHGQPEEVKHFEVAEYVLPKFSVTVIPPKVFLGNMENLNLEICARYTHGQPVKGDLLLRVEPKIYMSYFKYQDPSLFEELQGNPDKYTSIIQVPIKGCHKESIAASILGLDDGVLKPSELNVTATVTEEGTGTAFSESKMVQVERHPLKLDFQASSQYYKPGFVYNGLLEVKEAAGLPAVGQQIQICRGYGEERRCRNYTSDEHGHVLFQIPPLATNSSSIQIQASSPSLEEDFPKNQRWEKQLQQAVAHYNVMGWYSPSKSYLKVVPQDNHGQMLLACGGSLNLDVLYTTEPDTKQHIHYQVISRGKIVKWDSIHHDSKAESFPEKVDASLLLYKPMEDVPLPRYITKATVSFEILPNMAPKSQLVVYYVRPDGEVVADYLTFLVDQCLPNKVDLKWTDQEVGPGSTVGLKVKAEPDSLCGLRVVDKSVELLRPGEQLNVQKVFQALEPFQITEYQPPVQSNRIEYCLDKNDDNPSFPVPMPAVPDLGAPVQQQELAERKKRSFFGRPIYHASHADAILAFDKAGLLVLSDLTLETRPCLPTDIIHTRSHMFLPGLPGIVGQPEQAYFMLDSVALPYQSESFELNSPEPVLREYFPETWLWSLETIHVELKESESFKLEGEKEKTLCLDEQGKEVVTFDLTFLDLGEVNITIVARIDPNYPVACGPDVVLAVSDAIVKPVRVEPEGFPVDVTKNWFLCADDFGEEDEVTLSHSLSLPKDVVPDSARAWVTASGDLLGPSLQGLKKLVRVPTGCGEQNMITLAPNIFVLQYLESTGQLKAELKTELVQNMETGYQRELKYKHRDGSFSAFGESDGDGSMWLTAFVVKCFGQSLPFITVDRDQWRESVRWITRQQLENGCFPSIGRVIHNDLQGGLEGEDSGTTTALSAFVLVSLMESGVTLAPSFKENAVFCLKANTNPSTYALAVSTYAFLLAGEKDLGAASMDRLLQRAKEKDGLLWWEASSKGASDAVDIETTAYGILSLVTLNRVGDSARALSAVRWIASKRNSNGGFTSTQDTVMALQALARYSAHVGLGTVNMDVLLSNSSGWEHAFSLSNSNRLVQQMISIPTLPSEITINAAGDGCALVQAGCQISKNSRHGMFMGMVSDMIQRSHEMVKRWEVAEETGELSIYLDYLDQDGICLAIPLAQKLPVKNPKPALIKLHDYYAPEIQDTQLYSIEECVEKSESHQLGLDEGTIPKLAFSPEDCSQGETFDPDMGRCRDAKKQKEEERIFSPGELEEFKPDVLALPWAERHDHSNFHDVDHDHSNFHDVDHDLEFPSGLETQPTIRGNASVSIMRDPEPCGRNGRQILFCGKGLPSISAVKRRPQVDCRGGESLFRIVEEADRSGHLRTSTKALRVPILQDRLKSESQWEVGKYEEQIRIFPASKFPYTDLGGRGHWVLWSALVHWVHWVLPIASRNLHVMLTQNLDCRRPCMPECDAKVKSLPNLKRQKIEAFHELSRDETCHNVPLGRSIDRDEPAAAAGERGASDREGLRGAGRRGRSVRDEGQSQGLHHGGATTLLLGMPDALFVMPDALLVMPDALFL